MTAIVQAAGAGSYTVANVQAGTGQDRYAGWSLVVAYRVPGASPRNLTVFDGFASINSGDPPREIPISGFTTPKTGSVDTKVGLVTYEGDRGGTGDSLALAGKVLSDASNPANNFFNSAISVAGVPVHSKQPDFDNQLGYDAMIADAPGALANGATSTTIKLQTTGDTYLPGVVFFSTEVFAPDVTAAKSVSDVNGGIVAPGDILEFAISGTNRGQDAATDLVVTDPVPANTTVVPSSLPPGATYDPVGRSVSFRVGTVAPGGSYRVSFRVTVDAGTTGTIANGARIDYLADTLGFPLQGESNRVSVDVLAPDLTITKLHTPAALPPGATASYLIDVSNVGTAPTTGTVVVDDPIPAGMTPTGATGDGWSCAVLAAAIRCTRSDALAPGGAWPRITATATVSPTATGSLRNTATVSAEGDLDPANNNASNDVPTVPFADLGLSKFAVPNVVDSRGRVTYTLRVRNNGRVSATGVTLADPLPAGLTLVSATPSQGSCSGAVTCDLGGLAVFASATVTVVADVGAGHDGQSLANTATIAANEPEPAPDPTPNSATAAVYVRPTANVKVTKRLVGTAAAGRPVTYSLTAHNNGPGPATAARIDDDVPSVVQAPAATVVSGGGSCTTSGHLVSCALDPIAPGATAEVRVTGTLARDAAGKPLLNGLLYTQGSSSPGAPPGAQVPPAGAVAGPAADLGVANSGPARLARGGVTTYRLRVTNHGVSTATRVRLTDTAPAGATFARLPKGCTSKGRSASCKLPNLRVRAFVERTFGVRLPARAHGRLTNGAKVRSALVDPVTANNRDRFTARTGPRLVLAKTAGTRTGVPGGRLRYTLTLRNAGPGTARGVRLCDRPGRGLRLGRTAGARRTRTRACWTFRSLRSGQRVRRVVTARVASKGPSRLVNRASAGPSGAVVVASATVRRQVEAQPPRFTG